MGKVLARTEVDGISAVVLDPSRFHGKVLWETKAWRSFFGKKTREAPAGEYIA